MSLLFVRSRMEARPDPHRLREYLIPCCLGNHFAQATKCLKRNTKRTLDQFVTYGLHSLEGTFQNPSDSKMHGIRLL
jgi:hypothetical protein